MKTTKIIDSFDINTDIMGDHQVGMFFFENEDEYTNARLAISRALGLPEPVLYDDVDEEPVTQDVDSEDWDRALEDIIDIQERMAKGIKMIQECNRVLDAANSGKRIPYDAYCAWMERKKKLWAHWHYLKDCCVAQIGEDKWLWVKYFQLAESTLDCSGYTNDDPDCPVWLKNLDEMTEWYEDSVDDYQE